MGIHLEADESEACIDPCRSFPQRHHSSPTQGSSSAANTTVLIVDDDPVNLELAKQCIRLADYRMLTAINGEEAVQVALSCRPDIILMDIHMPVMNGCEAALLIRKAPEIRHTVGIIAVTALVTAPEVAWIKKSGFDGYITKPYRLQDLLVQISILIARRDGRGIELAEISTLRR